MQYNRFRYKDFDIIIVGEHKTLSLLLIDYKDNFGVKANSAWQQDEDFYPEAKAQIIQYLKGERKSFDLKIDPQGTAFQKKVWKQLQKIPYGTTISYKELATAIGNEKASRAVGSANSNNPIPIIIPCHRVIASNGNLAGYAYGTDCKRDLLELEKLNNNLEILQSFYNIDHWWPGDTAFEIMVGSVLTQNTTWINVEKALQNFGDQLSPDFIEKLPHDKLAEIIKPCGYYNQKAKTLKHLTEWFKGYNYNPTEIDKVDGEKLRKGLLSIKGIGPETADSILLYALNRPYFVVDAYTKRILKRFGITVPRNYEELRLKLESIVSSNPVLYANYHGCIVNLAKEFCLTNPQCEKCPLTEHCPKLI